jgi:hypothetical protein
MVPPPPYDGPHGSHGPLPFYTRTDADFLQPAGEPHYASVRAVSITGDATTTDFLGRAVHGRMIASTQATEVLAQQSEPLVVAGRSLAVNPNDVRTALGRLDTLFQSLGYPRPGLYTVDCEASAFATNSSFFRGFRDPTCTSPTGLYGVGLTYVEMTSTTGWAFLPWAWVTQTQSTRSQLTYFVPKAPPGKRVQSATLRAFAWMWGRISAVRLNGKAPVSIDPPRCAAADSCYAWLTWNFTEEARALAGTGGGELPLALDPLPPVVYNSEPGASYYQNERIAVASLQSLAVNYPWRHDYDDNALTLTFETECPRELTVSVKPTLLRPEIPQILKGAVAAPAFPARATVEARVTTCPGATGMSPASVEVTLDVTAPTAGSPDAAGHLHASVPWPTGTFERPRASDGLPLTRCLAQIQPDGTGSCAVTYFPYQVSGVETIVARAEGFAEARTTVTVKVPGLQNFATFGGGPWRLTGDSPGLHTDSHWATSNTISKTMVMAARVREDYSASMGVNDLSLIWGGMFDINGDWNTRFHITHRQGTGADVDRCALSLIPNNPNPQSNDEKTCPAGWVVLPKEDYFRKVCRAEGGNLANEATIHCEFPQ